MKAQADLLLALVDRGAAQIEIAATFPYRTWAMIRGKYVALRREALELSGPQPIKDDETYEQYLRYTDGGAVQYGARSGERWNSKETAHLLELLESGAAQADIAAAFPHRNWKRIRAKITELKGADFKVPGPRVLRSHETYEAFRLRSGTQGKK